MGWCSEFGPHINEGCDHAMVAGRQSCSCPECHTVCTGRYDGCRSVWVAGPREVHLLVDGARRAPVPPDTSASRAVVKTSTKAKVRRSPVDNGHSNGNGNGTGNGNGKSNGNGRGGGAERDPAVAGANGSVALHILLTELRIVQSRLDQVHRLCVAAANDDKTDRAIQLSESILKEFDSLPNRIAGALAAALQDQHRRVMQDVRTAIDEAVADLRPTL